jgi:hypothetical protein
MTAYRYTKIVVDASNDGNSDVLAQEIELRGSLGGADLTTAALAGTNASGSVGYYSGAEGPDKAFNDSTANWWQPRGVGTYIIWDHGAGTPQHVEQIRWIAHGSYLSRTPNKFTVWGSDDLVTWTPDWAQTSCGTWATNDRTFDRAAWVPLVDFKITKQSAYVPVINPGLMVAKQGAYVGKTNLQLLNAKQSAYVPMTPPGFHIAKQCAYVVMMPTPPEDNRRMSLM